MSQEPEFRVGGKQPGNLYRNNQRFGFVIRDEDGPMAAAALNAYAQPAPSTDDLRGQIAVELASYWEGRPMKDVASIAGRLAEQAMGIVAPSLDLARKSAEFWEDKYAKECERAEARVAELTRERDVALDLLDVVLGQFQYDGHPGEPCSRTGWIRRSTLRAWRGVAKDLRGRPPAQEAPDGDLGNPEWREHTKHGDTTMSPNCPYCPSAEEIAGAAQESPPTPEGIPREKIVVHATDCLRAERGRDAPCICGAQEAGEPPAPRVWREGDPEPPLDVVLLRLSDPVDGCAYMRRTPAGLWWFVATPHEKTDPEGWAWDLAFDGEREFESLTEVLEGGGTDG